MVSLLLPVIYLAFISLGLPDALLGAAWPSMYPQLGAGVAWAGGVSMIISVGTIVSSLASDWLNNKLGTGRGHSAQRCHHRRGAVWVFDLHAVLAALPVGYTVWPGCRQCGRRAEQLCGPAL